MLLPLHDKNPLRIIPFEITTFLILLTCVAVFLFQKTIAIEINNAFTLSYGMIPAVLFDYRSLAEELIRVPAEFTLLTSLFLHGGWMHLISNLLYLWIFGDNVEDCMGHIRFLLFYLLCGFAASFTHAMADPSSSVPLVGASGAIAGILGAYLILHPRVKVLVLVFKGIPLRLPAFLIIGFWVGLQVFNVLYGSPGNTAWWAHIGGFICGMALIPLFKYKSVPLFDGRVEH